MSSPLEKTFNLPTDNDLDELEQLIAVTIPDNPNLADIAKLSLDAYRMQLHNLAAVEPKYRGRYMEVANMYLNTARDALAKAEDLRLKKEKQDAALNKDSEETPVGGKSKAELLDKISKEKRALH